MSGNRKLVWRRKMYRNLKIDLYRLIKIKKKYYFNTISFNTLPHKHIKKNVTSMLTKIPL